VKLDAKISAVVTGGASGLGAAVARAFAGQGVRVAIFDLNKDQGEAFADTIGALFVPADVTTDESIERAFALARAAHGQERVLVNCAGIVASSKTVSRDRESGAVQRSSMAVFERSVRVNLIGTYRVLSISASGMAGLEPLQDGERGVIVNTASIAAMDGQIGQSAYAASKAGVVGMTLPIARDLASEGIRINTILPGVMETAMIASMPDKVRASLAASVPYPSRLGAPDEFASLVLEICRNCYLNGESIRLDGAMRMGAK